MINFLSILHYFFALKKIKMEGKLITFYFVVVYRKKGKIERKLITFYDVVINKKKEN